MGGASTPQAGPRDPSKVQKRPDETCASPGRGRGACDPPANRHPYLPWVLTWHPTSSPAFRMFGSPKVPAQNSRRPWSCHPPGAGRGCWTSIPSSHSPQIVETILQGRAGGCCRGESDSCCRNPPYKSGQKSHAPWRTTKKGPTRLAPRRAKVGAPATLPPTDAPHLPWYSRNSLAPSFAFLISGRRKFLP